VLLRYNFAEKHHLSADALSQAPVEARAAAACSEPACLYHACVHSHKPRIRAAVRTILFTLGVLVLVIWLLSWFQQVRIWTGYVFTTIERGRMEILRTSWWYSGYSLCLGSNEGWPIQWWFAIKSRASDFRFTAPFWLWIGIAGGLLWSGRPGNSKESAPAAAMTS
jgi:hypothetical protein